MANGVDKSKLMPIPVKEKGEEEGESDNLGVIKETDFLSVNIKSPSENVVPMSTDGSRTDKSNSNFAEGPSDKDVEMVSFLKVFSGPPDFSSPSDNVKSPYVR